MYAFCGETVPTDGVDPCALVLVANRRTPEDEQRERQFFTRRRQRVTRTGTTTRTQLLSLRARDDIRCARGDRASAEGGSDGAGRAALSVPAAPRACQIDLQCGHGEGAPARMLGPLREWLSGGVLLSHPVSRAVPSALRGLASGFGM